MGLNTFVRRRGFRNFMSKLYGWGASVVILGALFKINHYPFANEMLIVGLGTEAIIFFFSAFEPPYVEPDWSLVYPELGGLYHGDETAESVKKKPTQQLDDLLKQSNIDQKLMDRLGDGLRKLSDNTSKLSEITDAAGVTNEYLTKVKGAAKSVENLSKSYDVTAETLQKDVNASAGYSNSIKAAGEHAAQLSNVYKEASETLKGDINVTKEFTNSMKTAMQSANSLAEQYTKSAEALSLSAKQLDFATVDGKSYTEKLHQISEKLAALNSVYELQLQSNKDQMQSTAQVRDSMAQLLKTMKESADTMATYKDQMNLLTQRISSLNEVYGGMLTAMSGKAK
ncbi:MAG TPA: gliding motility protein GldL [Bacteroidales bacterium]|nr:gliding motility protein GldL [Bacteroidales bacterium]HNQ83104.1 gliding motility protein GldL [Bacteroidales bacterium]HOX78302.1 gliding motility protein GldL [Bacteroidales bacterium]HPI85806.1 gliding motility protein GldL [Bacteroidales bacterium]HPM92276.1 gliding motility protein GldL [Bacteroidales bacterium]